MKCTTPSCDYRKALTRLCNQIAVYLNRMDEVMKGPSTPARGEAIAKLSNALELANDALRLASEFPANTQRPETGGRQACLQHSSRYEWEGRGVAMTHDEALEISARVVAKFWPDWWSPGQQCPGHEQLKFLHPVNWQIADLVCSHGMKDSHEIPPPNLLEPANFVRALTLAQQLPFWPSFDFYETFKQPSRNAVAVEDQTGRGVVTTYADTPAEALLLALDALRQREESK